MTHQERYDELLRSAMNGRLSRRQVLRRAGLLGLSFPAIAALLAACGGDDEDETPTTGAVASPGATATRPASSPVSSPVASPAGTPAGTPRGTPAGSPTGGATFTKDKAPPVPNAAQAKQYSGQKITYYGDAVGSGADFDQVAARQFTQETGIEVNVVPRPQNATDSYAQFQRFFQGRSADVDVLMIDVIWPGAFAPHLVDLSQQLGDVAERHYETIVENNTIDGKLVAIPWFADFGMLFYRTDLLQKYGISNPPTTWDELEEQAQEILEGERGANANFQGFVFQGNAYEGLTCNALEWIASVGGGTIIEDGDVTLNNQDAVNMLNRAKGWIGGIAPRGVTSYQEEDARNAFQGGNSAFMRNWPYAYAAGNLPDSPIRGKFDVAPLPANANEDNVGTVGGWQLAVSNYSDSKEASIEFVRYLASPEVQTWRAAAGSYVPTIPSVAENPAVLEAMPFLAKLQDVVRVTRPSSTTGERYNEVSTAFYQGVNQILNGADANSQVQQITQRIERIVG